ncbi:YceD family protein [Actinocrinis sp.]|uniref:YceD family protein n=1 Tax=Actinocrinis sp. TaxID=1920516 RepID=UPI002D70017B|nr:YceD family protein [Actinocrinis sp.]HZP52034.1 YceD family protein [Actinocrinis sp.]
MPAAPKPRRLDARSPFVFDARELGRRPGAMREFDRDLPAADLLGGEKAATLDGLYSAEGADLRLTLRVESVVEGILATGRVSGSLVGECVRCLDPVEVDLDAEFQELFYYDLEDLTAEEAEEAQRVVEDLIDVGPLVHDAVMLELPLQPLCEEDCPGLCAQCGARLADDPDHGHETVDPRWAALSSLAQGGLPGGPESAESGQQRGNGG